MAPVALESRPEKRKTLVVGLQIWILNFLPTSPILPAVPILTNGVRMTEAGGPSHITSEMGTLARYLLPRLLQPQSVGRGCFSATSTRVSQKGFRGEAVSPQQYIYVQCAH